MGSGGLHPSFLTPKLDGGEWLVSRRGDLPEGKDSTLPAGCETGWAVEPT
jgi:hypothetical protein